VEIDGETVSRAFTVPASTSLDVNLSRTGRIENIASQRDLSLSLDLDDLGIRGLSNAAITVELEAGDVSLSGSGQP
jgi:hypothetical protein